jgi:hypothetical protein
MEDGYFSRGATSFEETTAKELPEQRGKQDRGRREH